eukprot:287899-Ditylum_brightwellii.AAC.1
MSTTVFILTKESVLLYIHLPRVHYRRGVNVLSGTRATKAATMADDQLTPLSLPPLLTNLTKYSQGEEFEKIKHDDATDEDQQSLDSDDLAIKSDESIEDARLEQDHNDGAVNQNDHQGNANDKEGKKVGVGELTQKRKQGTPGRP